MMPPKAGANSQFWKSREKRGSSPTVMPAELAFLRVDLDAGQLTLNRAKSAICAAERMDIGHRPDKCVPGGWLVLTAASV
jgi:hypothetical protein